MHTSDLHSRLLPFPSEVSAIDAAWGLGALGETRVVGGFARLGFVVARERQRSSRALLLDSGDAWSGGLAFELFHGAAELVALSHMGVAAQALGNHEFDQGQANLVLQRWRFAEFPALAANYLASPHPGAAWFDGWSVENVAGLLVGVIGVGNRSSLRALTQEPNDLGIVPLETSSAVQRVIDALRTEVDVVVLLSHLGLDADEALIRRTAGLDVVLGGHNHLLFQHERALYDCADGFVVADPGATRRSRPCRPRRVLLVHSGAYGRFLGRLDLVLSDLAEAEPGAAATDGFEVVDQRYQALPISDDLPEDQGLRATLAPYVAELGRYSGLPGLLGYVPQPLSRSLEAGDSALGNLAAQALLHVWTERADLALINSSALRADLPAGPLTEAALFQALPFNDAAVLFDVSGKELEAIFQALATKTQERGCRAQLSLANAVATFHCPCSAADAPHCSPELYALPTETPCVTQADCPEQTRCGTHGQRRVCLRRLAPHETVLLATTKYFASQSPSLAARRALQEGLSLASSVSHWIQTGEACAAPNSCPAALVTWAASNASREVTPELATSLCRSLACVDVTLGAVADGRVRVLP